MAQRQRHINIISTAAPKWMVKRRKKKPAHVQMEKGEKR